MTSIPLGEIIEEEAGLATTQQQAQQQRPLISPANRDVIIDRFRQHHSGILNVDVRFLIVGGLLVIIAVVLWLFFRNMSKARKLMAEQLLAQRTAQVLATQLLPLLPANTHDTSGTSAATATPVMTVRPSTPLAVALGTIDSLGKLVDDERVAVWVMDKNGFVYADSKTPSRAAAAASGTRPNYNLRNLATILSENSAPGTPTNVAEVILQTAQHGAGIVPFVVPSLGTASASTINVSLFVQPIAGTAFFVAVQVGSKSSLKDL